MEAIHKFRAQHPHECLAEVLFRFPQRTGDSVAVSHHAGGHLEVGRREAMFKALQAQRGHPSAQTQTISFACCLVARLHTPPYLVVGCGGEERANAGLGLVCSRPVPPGRGWVVGWFGRWVLEAGVASREMKEGQPFPELVFMQVQ